jgi:beta-barrel assembly-enhancing protease
MRTLTHLGLTALLTLSVAANAQAPANTQAPSNTPPPPANTSAPPPQATTPPTTPQTPQPSDKTDPTATTPDTSTPANTPDTTDNSKDKKDKNVKAKTDILPSPGEALDPHIKTGSEDDVASIGTRNIGGRGLGNWYSTDWEIRTGKQYSMEIEKSAHMVTDPVIVEYVNRVGQNIVNNSD